MHTSEETRSRLRTFIDNSISKTSSFIDKTKTSSLCSKLFAERSSNFISETEKNNETQEARSTEVPIIKSENASHRSACSKLHLEDSNVRLLQHIQGCLGLIMRMNQSPDITRLMEKLATEVKEFGAILEDEGLEVVFLDNNHPEAFISVYDDSARSSSQVIVPAILRGKSIILKGTRCLPSPKSAATSAKNVHMVNEASSSSVSDN